MTSTEIIKDEQFINNTTDFFNILFEPTLKSGCGEIEIRTFPKNAPPQQFFCNSESEAALTAGNLCNNGIDVYFGVNPRVGNAGKKQNIHYLAAFHAEVDYGTDGHDKKSIHQTYEKAIAAIKGFKMKPTILNHSGGGFHCYWVLNTPLKVEERGVELFENVNKALLQHLGGDGGTHDISRVLRVPGTFNLKLPNNPREVTSIWMEGHKYNFEDFEWLIEDVQVGKLEETAKEKPQRAASPNVNWNQGMDQLPAVSDKIKSLIIKGKDGSYPSRSEADQAVITALVGKGLGFSEIKSIFDAYPIGEKYREHQSPDKYLQHNINTAQKHC